MARVQEHLHKWKNDLTCRCGETHPLIMELRQRIEELEQWPSKDVSTNPSVFRVEFGEATNGHHALDADLQAIVDATRQSPQVRAKMARYAFSARGWPNEEHPGTVRDFLAEHGVPIIAENSISTRQEK